jgi:excinuclease ABC subunit C
MKASKGDLQRKASGFPDQPGVYIMKDPGGEVIYIGKASSLRRRVSSYFQKADADPKTAALVRSIGDIEYIVTDSEIEALLLENTLIKKHLPKFNVRLKDDKRYPYIAVTLEEDFPRVILTRRLKAGANRFFGPYTDAKAARAIIAVINSTFKLKTCGRDLPLKKSERSCLNYQMMRCQGACRGTVSRDEYHTIVEGAIGFLEGNIAPVMEKLQAMMDRHSAALEYEKAARVRDIIADIRRFTESQKVLSPVGRDQDIMGVSIQAGEAILVLFEFRAGALLGRKVFVYGNAGYSTPAGVVQSFLIDYYRRTEVPPRVIIPCEIEDRKSIEVYLSGLSSRKVSLSVARMRDDRGIVSLIQKNIDLIAAERGISRETGDRQAGLIHLREMLGLGRAPAAIECFDISNIQGKQAVASMVRFSGGLPDRKNYRRFRIRGYEGANDPGMIHEAVGRRLQHLLNEGHPPPDLIVIDGGPSQLSRAIEARDALGMDVTIISLAKRLEEVYTDPSGPPLRIDAASAGMKILTGIRDEAHRFAIGYHRRLREKQATVSSLDGVPGIGEKRRRLILEHVREPSRLGEMTLEELLGVPGLGEKAARAVYRHFHPEGGPGSTPLR